MVRVRRAPSSLSACATRRTIGPRVLGLRGHRALAADRPRCRRRRARRPAPAARAGAHRAGCRPPRHDGRAAAARHLHRPGRHAGRSRWSATRSELRGTLRPRAARTALTATDRTTTRQRGHENAPHLPDRPDRLGARPARAAGEAVRAGGEGFRHPDHDREGLPAAPVNAASILGVIALGVEQGDYVTLIADGDGAESDARHRWPNCSRPTTMRSRR